MVSQQTLVMTSIAISLLTVTKWTLQKKNVVSPTEGRHARSRPVVRGVGVALGIALLTSVGLAHGSVQFNAVTAVTCSAFCGLGFIDDLRPIDPKIRLAAQFVFATVVAVYYGRHFGLTPLQVLLVAGLFLYLPNVFNFMDGVDGMSALHAMVFGGTYLAVNFSDHRNAQVEFLALTILIFGATFLPYNLLGKQCFLGDSGSYLFGAILAAITSNLFAEDTNLFIAMGPLSIYIFDTSFTIISRIRRHKNLLEAHSEHIFQRFSSYFASHIAVSLICLSFSIIAACITVLNQVDIINTTVATSLGVLLLASYWLLSIRVERTKEFDLPS